VDVPPVANHGTKGGQVARPPCRLQHRRLRLVYPQAGAVLYGQPS
jgi:hypothetical protein